MLKNNQFLLNDINNHGFDTLRFGSIVFDQSHHIPYGTFFFNDISDL